MSPVALRVRADKSPVNVADLSAASVNAGRRVPATPPPTPAPPAAAVWNIIEPPAAVPVFTPPRNVKAPPV